MDSRAIRPVDEEEVLALERQLFGEAGPTRQVVDFDRIWKIVARYKWRLILLALLGAAVGYLTAFSKTPLYRAVSEVIVSPEYSGSEELVKSPFLFFVPKSFYATQKEVIRSHLVLERVPERLSEATRKILLAPPEKRGLAQVQERIEDWLRSLLDLLQTDDMVGDLSRSVLGEKEGGGENAAAVEQAPPGGEPVGAQSRRARENARLLGVLMSGISVEEGNTERILRIAFVSGDPAAAAEVANAIADTYLEYLVERKSSRSKTAGTWLGRQVEESRKKLEASEAALRAYQAKHNLPTLKTVQSLSSEKIRNINEELQAAQARVDELAKRYGPRHPSMIEARRLLAQARSRAGGVAEIDQVSGQAALELQNLEAEVKTNRELYELFLARFHEVDLGVDTTNSNTTILDRAQPPGVPFVPNMRRGATFGALWGLALALISIFFREFHDRTFKTQEQVEERLKLPVLGVVPLITRKQRKKAKGDGAPERYYTADPRSNFSEVINHVRTGIIYSNVDAPPKVVLVTSSLPQEGKTTCAANLAQSFSKLGKTLLLDADFRKPRIAKIASVEDITGLTGYVIGQNSLEECLVEDPGNDQLFIMRSGEVPPNPLELLSSDRFKETLHLMRERFEYIVVDSAPLIPVSDAVVLGALVDVILMVIKADSTTHNDVETAIKRLQAAHLNPLGIMLAQVDYRKSHKYYGKYDYAYSKSYYTSS